MKTTFEWPGGTVSGEWHPTPSRPRAGLILGHGAGHNLSTALLVQIGDALVEQGITTLRFNFPYTEAGRRAPNPQPQLEACYTAVARTAAEHVTPLFIGGKSLGGRMASHVAASGFDTAGLVFLGYPLHPPGKPERIRDAHLTDIKAPMLFLQGTKDPFATTDLLNTTIARLPTATLVPIEGGDHSFKVSGRKPDEVTAELIAHIAAFIGTH